MKRNKIDLCPIDDRSLIKLYNEVEDSDVYQKLLNYAPVCIHEIGLDGCLIKMNRAGLDMMGVELEDQVIDEPYTNFVGNNNQKWVNSLLQKAKKGQTIANFEFCIGTNKRQRTFSSNFIPMHNSQKQVVKLMGITREITEEVRAKEALKILNRELKTKVKEATAKLQNSLDTLTATQSQLVESRKMASLGGLIAGVAHEINTPLGIGVTAASSLLDATSQFTNQYANREVTNKDLISYLNEVKESTSLICSNLDRTVNLLMKFKQVAVDQSCREVCTYKIKQLFNNILQSLKPKFQHNNFIILLHCVEDISVKGETRAFVQIITNLVNNTLIHGFENMDSGNIDIRITRNKDSVQCVYSDTGKGISKEHTGKIFEPFYTTNRGSGGTGLGLHIVYNLVVQSLKGSIKYNEKFNEGSQFVIEFPINIHLKAE